jgi:Uma2 family endonuclease
LSGKSSRVAVRLSTRLDSHAESQRLGIVLDSETAYQIFPKEPRRTRKLYLSFIQLGRLPNDEVPDGNMEIPPDLAVEVVSPNDEAVELNNKLWRNQLRCGRFTRIHQRPVASAEIFS